METLYLTLLYLLFIILIYQERKKLKRLTLNFLKNKRIWFILILTALASLLILDGNVSPPKNFTIIEMGEKLGNGNYLIPTLTALTYSSYLLGLNKTGDILKEALLKGALSGIIADVIKVGTARARPKASDKNPFKWFSYEKITSSDYWSFPSGHTALAGGVFFSLFSRTKGPLRFVFLAFPPLTALSRVMSSSHWPSDVIFSLVLSFLIAKGGRR
ncbi:MAG: phosphatase PAP2 family protein [Synergistetes bacterium]|nr:MAG: Uncharacterized protein XD52_0993 [bacterium 42_11]MBC7332585.1 phosphatase PAP2 family protein [Synergistota bacterium]